MFSRILALCFFLPAILLWGGPMLLNNPKISLFSTLMAIGLLSVDYLVKQNTKFSFQVIFSTVVVVIGFSSLSIAIVDILAGDIYGLDFVITMSLTIFILLLMSEEIYENVFMYYAEKQYLPLYSSLVISLGIIALVSFLPV